MRMVEYLRGGPKTASEVQETCCRSSVRKCVTPCVDVASPSIVDVYRGEDEYSREDDLVARRVV